MATTTHIKNLDTQRLLSALAVKENKTVATIVNKILDDYVDENYEYITDEPTDNNIKYEFDADKWLLVSNGKQHILFRTDSHTVEISNILGDGYEYQHLHRTNQLPRPRTTKPHHTLSRNKGSLR